MPALSNPALVVQPPLPTFAEIAASVRDGHTGSLDQLWRVFQILSGSLRRRHIGIDFEDHLHDTFVAVVQQLRSGNLRDPHAFATYIHSVSHLAMCEAITRNAVERRILREVQLWSIRQRKQHTPESILMESERFAAVRALLQTLNDRDREILRRFYLDEEPKERICYEMRLSEDQFRLYKSRAKAKLQGKGEAAFMP